MARPRYDGAEILTQTMWSRCSSPHYSGDGFSVRPAPSHAGGPGGDAELLGADTGLAAAYDLGMLDIFFNGLAAFLHASAVVGASGVTAGTFLPYAERMLTLLHGEFASLAAHVDTGRHTGRGGQPRDGVGLSRPHRCRERGARPRHDGPVGSSCSRPGCHRNPWTVPTLLPDRRIDNLLTGWPHRGGVGSAVASALAGMQPVDDIVQSDHYAV